VLNLILFERLSLQKQNFIFEWIQVLENFMTYFIFHQKIVLLFAWKRKFLLILALMWKLFIYFLKLVNFKLDFTITRYYLLLSGLKILFTISQIHYKEVHNKEVTLTLALWVDRLDSTDMWTIKIIHYMKVHYIEVLLYQVFKY
jgi:hypothetical protein